MGRFITPDWAAKATAVPYANFGNPQSLNLYSYVKNDPTTFGDPDGHDPPNPGTAAIPLTAGGEISFTDALWTLGSTLLPALGGGALAVYAENTIAGNNYIRADAEMQYQAALNNLAVTINAMARAGKSTEQLRKEWEKLTGQKWPTDPNTRRKQDAHHKEPKADGGVDAANNIEPMPHDAHVDHHKKNGDFKRWGKRGQQTPPEPKPEPPKPEPPKPEPPPEPKQEPK